MADIVKFQDLAPSTPSVDPIVSCWVGGETGIVKGVDLCRREFQNFGDLSTLNKSSDEVCRMCWFDDCEEKICIGTKSGMCKIFDVEKKDFVDKIGCFTQEEGEIIGLERNEGVLLACSENGILRILKGIHEEKTDIRVGNHIARMRKNPFQLCQVATGGNENVLKLWDLNKPKQPLFKAKNVRNDQLDLQVPDFVKDIGFLQTSGSLPTIVVGTAYHKLRLYDPKAQKRPVLDISYKESPITCVSIPSHEKFVIIGNTYGDMAAIDIRNGANLGSYKSFSGSINDIQCHKTESLVASCGLDRFLRIHHVDTRQLVDKIYLKSRLKSLLFSKSFKKVSEDVKNGSNKRKHGKEIKESGEESDDDDVWDNMGIVEDDAVIKKTNSKKTKLGCL